jgi:putative colanic acid biosynthesis glycosyltransferase WcaI
VSRQRLLVLNQYYWPGVEATAHLLTELCEALAGEYDVTVVTGRLRGRDDAPDREIRNGVRVIRVRSAVYDRAVLSRRGVNYVTYLARAAVRALSLGRPDVILCMTDPPMVGALAVLLGRRFETPAVVVSEDVFPEIAVELKRLSNPVAVALLGAITSFALRRADRVVAIGDTMGRRLEKKGVEPRRMRVIPNWVDTSLLTPRPRDNDWARMNGLVDRFVVMHSGNVGHAQNLDNLIRATTFLRDLDDLSAVIVGFGARHAADVVLAEQLEADAVRFLPYQPRELLPESLSSADVHFVGLGKGLAGYVVPSRLYGILAVGRPVVVAADAESETARVVQEVGCGLVIPPGQPELLAATLRELHAGEHDLDEMGRRGLAYVQESANRSIAFERYLGMLDELVAEGFAARA